MPKPPRTASDTPDTGARQILRLADLPARKPTRFTLAPDAEARARLAGSLGIPAVEAVTFTGELRPAGRRDWVLEAVLDARIVQECIVSLAPVPADIHEKVLRRYLADMPEVTAEETEMPEDDTAEPLPASIDLAAVMQEALALALPLYPRAEGAELAQTDFAEPGTEALTDETARPFAQLAALMKKDRSDR